MIQNSNIKSFNCNFFACVKPAFINSTWNVTSSLDYMDGDIGNRKNGIIITDETFSDKGCIELARAYATYILKEFLNKMNDCNKLDIDSKFEEIKLTKANDLKMIRLAKEETEKIKNLKLNLKNEVKKLKAKSKPVMLHQLYLMMNKKVIWLLLEKVT